jgi:hypothetical protein
MTIRLPYETKAGVFDEAVTYLQLIEHLKLAVEACYVLGHYKKENGDELIGQGFLAVGQMWEKNLVTIEALATKGHRIMKQ